MRGPSWPTAGSTGTWRTWLTEGAAAFAALWRPRVEGEMAARLDGLSGPANLVRAVRHAVESGGKRFRALLFLSWVEALGGDPDESAPTAPWVEWFHAFTLVQDDLPCFDDDDLRRGAPSVHRLTDEATAILASDTLLGLSVEAALGAPGGAGNEVASDLVRLLMPDSLVGGQALDLALDAGAEVPGGRVEVNRLKTAHLFAHACRAAAWVAGAETAGPARFGERLGMAFQAHDDLQDLEPGHPDLPAVQADAEEHAAAASAALAEMGLQGSGPAGFLAWATDW